MPLNPSTRSESRNRLVYVKGVSIIVFFVALSVVASSSWLSRADLTYAETLPVAIEPTNTPVPIPTATVVPVPSASPSPSSGLRNLLLYENGGVITVTGNDTVREALMAQARNFLLRKWRDRGRGRLVLVVPERGAIALHRCFYVEPDASGVWRVTLEIHGEEPADFYFVEEIGVDAQGQPILTPSPSGPPAVSRALHLKQNANVKFGMVF